jgi:hypothetical protein
MSWLALFLGLILTAAGVEGIYLSLDLRTTELGVLYATCGSIAVSGGFIVVAIALLIRRVDALRRTVLRSGELRPPLLPEASALALAPGGAPVAAGAEINEDRFSDASSVMNPQPAVPLDDEPEPQTTPINENRAGRLPTMETLESAPKELTPPTLVGRYSAGNANYSIFSDGSIEAETEQGAFKFASMGEFKSYIATKKS